MSKKNIGSTIGVLAAVTIGATAYASTMNNLDKDDQSKKVLDSNVSYVESNLNSDAKVEKKDYANEVKNTKFAEKTSDTKKISKSRNLADPTILESSSEQAIVKAVEEKFKKDDSNTIEANTVSNAVEEKEEIVVEKYVRVDALNVRSSKTDKENNVVDILYKNDKVSGVVEDGYLKTEKGYINLNFLADQPIEETDIKAEEEAKKAEEAKAEEEAKKAEEAKAEEEAKKVEEAKAEEEAKKAEEAKAEEEAKKVEEAKAEEVNKVISYTGWVNTESLNVRDGASVNSNLLSSLTKGEKVNGELQDGWLKISYNGQVAYINADYLSDTEVEKSEVKPVISDKKEEEEVKEETPQAIYYTGWVYTDSLRVRAASNTSSNVLGNLTKGDKVEGQLANGWLQISYNGQIGYVSADYLSDTEVEKPVQEPVEQPVEKDDVDYNDNSQSSNQEIQVSGNGQQVANIATSFVGSPYVWGGSSPSGFDCSGLVYYAYGQLGVNLNRNSQGQYSNGYTVSDLQAGDLVFFSYNGSIDHVGMIINSSGDFVHASTPSRGVVIDNIYSSWYQNSYVGAKRIF